MIRLSLFVQRMRRGRFRVLSIPTSSNLPSPPATTIRQATSLSSLLHCPFCSVQIQSSPLIHPLVHLLLTEDGLMDFRSLKNLTWICSPIDCSHQRRLPLSSLSLSEVAVVLVVVAIFTISSSAWSEDVVKICPFLWFWWKDDFRTWSTQRIALGSTCPKLEQGPKKRFALEQV